MTILKVFSVLCILWNILTCDTVADEEICSICSCGGNGIVDCADRAINSAFTSENWTGVSPAPLQVDLSKNRLVSITRFPSLPIQNLNISNCEISSIEDGAFMFLSSLVTLDLSFNKVSTSVLSRRIFVGPIVPGSLPLSFTNFRTLSLAHNEIHSLPQDIFNFLTEMISLDLSGNPLAFIDAVTMAAISDLTNLQQLKLSGCELEVIPEGLFRRQRKLQKLDLSDNRFTTIPSVLKEAVNLVQLNLDKNPFVTIEGASNVSALIRLRELHLCRLSKLQSIAEGSLGGLESLEILHLCYNPRLTYLDPKALVWKGEHEEEKVPEVKELYLNNNNITAVSSDLISRWDKIINLDFTNNPYVCDCNVQWMVGVLLPIIDSTPANGTQGNMVCKQPPEMSGLTFKYLYDTQKPLKCREVENLVTVMDPDGIIFLGVMIGAFVTFPVVLVITIIWKKGYFSKCRENTDSIREYDETEEL